MKKEKPTMKFREEDLIEVNLSELDGDMGVRTSKLALLWYRIKTFFPELYYASREYYFVQRDKVSVSDHGPLGKIHTITESQYVKMDAETKEVRYVHQPEHATVFSFFQMVLCIWVLRKKYAEEGYEYNSITLGDTAFAHKVKTGKELFEPHHVFKPVIILSPIVIVGLSLMALGLSILIAFYSK